MTHPTDELVLKLAEALLIASERGEGEEEALSEVRAVLVPLADDPDALLWSLTYAVVLCARMTQVLYEYVPDSRGRRDMVRTMVVAMMAATEQ